MRQVVTLALLGLSYLAFGFEINAVKITGQENAQLTFSGAFSGQQPSWKMNGSTLEIVWAEQKLAKEQGEKIEIESPHALIKRVTLTPAGKDSVKARIHLNGSTEDMKERVKFSQQTNEFKLSIDYPKQNASTLKLLQEEQTPLAQAVTSGKVDSSGNYRGAVGMVTGFLLLFVLGAWGFFRVFRKKGVFRGPRRYLIEQLGYCPLGAKAGVSLLKVGQEFVLVGVTPNQISVLSQLPKLQQQYEDESAIERGIFQETVNKHVDQLR